MNSPQMMTREELLEYAALDAFGLLDEYDGDRYTRGFHDAPAALQDEVKRLQADLATDPSFITSDEEPSFALRERVLAAVAAAIEREEAQLAPLATIGRGRGAEYDNNIRRGRYALSGMFWRAASFVLAACGIVMAYAWSGAVRQNDELIKYAIEKRDVSQIAQYLGDDFNAFVKHSVGKARVLRPVSDTFSGTATLYLRNNEDGTGSAFVLATAMPSNQKYSLKVKIANAWQEVDTFVSNGVIEGLHLDHLSSAVVASAATATWQIVDEAGAVVLQTT
ncbi:MAG TPA: hypothetical protein VMS30_03985 [Phycisphaerales bacterium]|nr:hypothetical protein [Phycisphaerales bacterium]